MATSYSKEEGKISVFLDDFMSPCSTSFPGNNFNS